MYFYLPHPRESEISGDTFEHLRSHRYGVGNQFLATDFEGQVYTAIIKVWDKKLGKAQIQILNSVQKPSSNQHELIQAIPDKLYLEKLVELAVMSGFTALTVFQSEYSPKQNLNLDRLAKIALQAALLTEQTSLLPIQVKLWEDLLLDTARLAQSVILEQHSPLVSRQSDTNQMKVWVGPEGGWSPIEVSRFQNLGIPFRSLTTDRVYPAWLAGSAWKLRT